MSPQIPGVPGGESAGGMGGMGGLRGTIPNIPFQPGGAGGAGALQIPQGMDSEAARRLALLHARLEDQRRKRQEAKMVGQAAKMAAATAAKAIPVVGQIPGVSQIIGSVAGKWVEKIYRFVRENPFFAFMILGFAVLFMPFIVIASMVFPFIHLFIFMGFLAATLYLYATD